MDLKQKADEIYNNLASYKKELKERQDYLHSQKQRYADEYKEAAAHGDASENSALDAAMQSMSSVNAEYYDVCSRLESLDKANDIIRYNSVGIILLYSTVQFSDGESTYVYRIMPEGISDLSKGFMTVASEMAKALLNHRVGDSVKVLDRTSNQMITYVIEGLY